MTNHNQDPTQQATAAEAETAAGEDSTAAPLPLAEVAAEPAAPVAPLLITPQGLALNPAWPERLELPEARLSAASDVEDFIRSAGIRQEGDFAAVTRAQVIAWRNAVITSLPDPAAIDARLHTIEALFRDLYGTGAIPRNPANRDFEHYVRQVYEAFLKDGDIAVDVGAHVGTHALPIAQAMAPAGKLYAIEPLPTCRWYLNHHLETQYPHLKENVILYDCALSNYRGEAEFINAVDAPWFSGLKTRVYTVPTALEKIPVQVHTFDALFYGQPHLEYIKIDAEGGEYHILLGAEKCIATYRPIVTFEFGINSIAEYKITAADMAWFWQGRDYHVYTIEGELLETAADFVRCAEYQRTWDYICIPAEKAEGEARILRALLS